MHNCPLGFNRRGYLLLQSLQNQLPPPLPRLHPSPRSDPGCTSQQGKAISSPTRAISTQCLFAVPLGGEERVEASFSEGNRGNRSSLWSLVLLAGCTNSEACEKPSSRITLVSTNFPCTRVSEAAAAPRRALPFMFLPSALVQSHLPGFLCRCLGIKHPLSCNCQLSAWETPCQICW